MLTLDCGSLPRASSSRGASIIHGFTTSLPNGSNHIIISKCLHRKSRACGGPWVIHDQGSPLCDDAHTSPIHPGGRQERERERPQTPEPDWLGFCAALRLFLEHKKLFRRSGDPFICLWKCAELPAQCLEQKMYLRNNSSAESSTRTYLGSLGWGEVTGNTKTVYADLLELEWDSLVI